MDEIRLIDGARLERGIKMLNFYSEKDKQFIIELVRSYPTIEAEPVRHGCWIEKEHYNLHGDNYCDCLCSECGHRISRPNGFYPDYCEDCGTKMDGGMEHG